MVTNKNPDKKPVENSNENNSEITVDLNYPAKSTNSTISNQETENTVQNDKNPPRPSGKKG